MLRKIKESIDRSVSRLLGNKRPIAVQLDLTNACNLSCSHCYHSNHLNVGALSLEKWTKIIEDIASFSLSMNFIPKFILCGGEPLTSSLLKPVLALLDNRFPESEISILTNGTIVTDRHLEIFKDKRLNFQVSLDGPDLERHDIVRGKGSFNKSREGILKLQGSGFEVSILSILSYRTRPWIRDFFVYAKSLGVHSQNFTRLVPEGAGSILVENGTDRPLQPLELKTTFVEILSFSHIYKVATATDQPLFALINEKLGSNGLFGINGIVVDYKGQLKVSSRANFVVGSLLENSLFELFLNHPIMQSLQNGDIEVCGECRFYKTCGGDRNAAFGAYGNFLAKDPGCWL